jgi:UDP-N-acetylmuramyl pentapeptide phosphotransferase/UDP-N-acetylglucosamine-1-phosphate transferase
MTAIILAFLISFLICLLIIKNLHLHQRLSADNRFDEPQKIHSHITPRIGGIAIFGGFLVAMIIRYLNDHIATHAFLLLTISSTPIFLLGLIEDVTKETGANKRLLTAVISAALSGWLSNNWVQSFGLGSLDGILGFTTVSIIFTIFAIKSIVFINEHTTIRIYYSGRSIQAF